jgi:hypothetical protein
MQTVIKHRAADAEILIGQEKGQRNAAVLHGERALVNLHKEPVVQVP